ncbi:hypothetical protein OUZ56_019509 [Daphnia magna]|uniref:Secreted protein n=1 Tax=Daphnia magna TaxID=35525 RepID=A0ABQ9ZBT3_9CRUS|nr:hypothetical protein OUZ56_019509 [Daphnia magna]
MALTVTVPFTVCPAFLALGAVSSIELETHQERTRWMSVNATACNAPARISPTYNNKEASAESGFKLAASSTIKMSD